MGLVGKRSGRVMALDLGDKRIGVAISDELWLVARGLAVIERTSRKADFRQIRQLAEEHDVELIIIGLPTLPSGDEGTRAAWARDYAADLGKAIQARVELWDESFSTQDAAASLRARGRGRKRRQERLDAVAAAFILQSFLNDASRPLLG